jgi:hypothetical protein
MPGPSLNISTLNQEVHAERKKRLLFDLLTWLIYLWWISSYTFYITTCNQFVKLLSSHVSQFSTFSLFLCMCHYRSLQEG